MRTRPIKIGPTTTAAEIHDQLVDKILVGEPFTLGRYRLSLQGILWVVDDIITGLKSIDGISQGSDAPDSDDINEVARVIQEAWKHDEWMDIMVRDYGEEVLKERTKQNARVRRGAMRTSALHQLRRLRTAVGGRPSYMGETAIKIANSLVRELERSGTFFRVRKESKLGSVSNPYSENQTIQVYAFSRGGELEEVEEILASLGFAPLKPSGRGYVAYKDPTHFITFYVTKTQNPKNRRQRVTQWRFYCGAPKKARLNPSPYPFD